MKALLISMLLTAAQPAEMYTEDVSIKLHCMPTFAEMTKLLSKDHKEAPVMLAQMSETTTIVFFVNKDKTTSTLVVTKDNGDTEQSCILWSGASPDGMSFSLNPSPDFNSSSWNET
jgi:hypothetical protein